MKNKFRLLKLKAFSLIEISMVILIIGVFIAGIAASDILIKKSRISAAQTITITSPINGIKDSALWLETSIDTSFDDSELTNGVNISSWFDGRKNAVAKPSIIAVGNGPTYSNTINYVHAVKFDGGGANYLQINDASFLNNTDYTIFVLEKKMDNSSNSYFLGDNPSGTANQKLALGYKADGTITHAQGTNSYDSSVSSYADSSDKPRLFVFVQDSSQGKKTYINGILAKSSSDTAQLSGITTLEIGKSYKGEIGEIAIFTRPLKSEERKSVEDYLSKKWTTKNLRDSVVGGSCTTGVVTTSGCSMTCNTSQITGVSSPSSINDGVTQSATCGQSGYDNSTISLTCSNSSLSGGSCGCNSATHFMVGGICVAKCTYNVTGGSPATGTVNPGSGNISCNTSGTHYTSNFPYTCSGGSAISGECSCATGYVGAGCTACNSAANYVSIGGSCVLGCNVTAGSNALATKVAEGTTSTPCASGYSGNLGYTCSGGVFTVTAACAAGSDCTASGGVSADTTSVPGSTIFKFMTVGSYTFTCPTTKSVQVLVVGGGGGGSGGASSAGGAGGGAGGVIYNGSFSVTAPIAITVGAGGNGSASTGAAFPNLVGSNGGSSSFSPSLVAAGGGGGGAREASSAPAPSGGSGGGGGISGTAKNGGAGTSGQGYAGGNNSSSSPNFGGGGGGGAGGAGQNGSSTKGGNGGDGIQNNITGTLTYYGGGGGASYYNSGGSSGTGGLGGGGNTGSAGTDGLGAGGGGAPSQNIAGSKGGSGVVIVRY